MGEPKPVASLSSGLLARKGQARPAMRPQGFGGFGGLNTGMEDLGWNDMGHSDMGHEAIKPVPLHAEIQPEIEEFVPVERPQVVLQREQLAEEFNAVSESEEDEEVEAESSYEAPVLSIKKRVEPKPLPTVAIARAKKAARGRKSKAAFTLRLDPERHLKLRLACAIERESAQAIVTEALDRYLSSLPELDDLASKVPANVAKHVA